jgi:protein-S-isoprenylcysteine O-methyltransferase Ste14
MRTVYTSAAYWSWIVLLLVWLPGYFISKPTVRTPHRVRQFVASLLFAGAYLLLFSTRATAGGPLATSVTPRLPLLGQIGLALDLAGVALAIWARLTLGRNWSGMITVKQDHELVQAGPYASIRHPIYTGLLTGLAGTALTIGWLASYLGVVSGLVAILVRVNDEEALMAQEFPESHKAYRQRTKKLIPFVW